MSVSNPSFLYIDDDPISRDVVRILLERVMGLSRVTFFETSHDFMDRIRALPEAPTIIFLALQVRPHDGYKMLAALRNDPTYQDATIIAVTANVMATDVEKMKESGFSGLISKPIIHRIFPELLNKILAGESVWYIS
ncbi:MAG: response regulator [Chloroflexota bacterium]